PPASPRPLKDPDWVASMQEEMQQFYNQQVWKLVPLPDGKIAIRTKWILKNKRDARGIVVYVDDIIFGSMNKAWCDKFEVLMKGEFGMSAMASRPDIMFLVSVVLDISDSDYAGSHGDRKSTTSGCQFLGRSLISWQCKKQIVVATSFTEAEYVAAASCCGQVLKIHTDENVADLLTKAFDGPRFHYLVYVYILTDSRRFYLVYCRMTAVSCRFLLYVVHIVGMPPMLLVVLVFLLVVVVYADGWVSAGSCTIPTSSYSFMLLDWFLLCKIHVKYRSFHNRRAKSPYDNKWAKKAQGKGGLPKPTL
nr:ribonuclease H-like domain, reverse transcriptase, RNA-dependent DNA polymerase [Tanacetum cinerariifolium]